jgi:hypothetical protein
VALLVGVARAAEPPSSLPLEQDAATPTKSAMTATQDFSLTRLISQDAPAQIGRSATPN